MSSVLKTPIRPDDVRRFNVGDVVYVSGVIYTARDKAHAKMLSDPQRPFSLRNACIYHSGPLIVKEGHTYRIIAAGPTTSARMNKQTPTIVKKGVTAIIGKGGMSSEVVRALAGRCFYLAFPGGCGILAKERIEEVLDVYYAELGFTEAVWKLQVRNFGPLLVAIDSHGESIYENIRVSSRAKLSQ
jgi:fumarate hydratase subunit beta